MSIETHKEPINNQDPEKNNLKPAFIKTWLIAAIWLFGWQGIEMKQEHIEILPYIDAAFCLILLEMYVGYDTHFK